MAYFAINCKELGWVKSLEDIEMKYLKPFPYAPRESPYAPRESGTHLWVSCNIQQYPSEYQISFAHVSSYVSSWNFAQSTVITLTCSVQNFKTIQPHFPRYWHFERGIHRSPVNSPHKGQWRGASMFSLICAWINGWVYNGEAVDFRRHRVHCNALMSMGCHLGVHWYVYVQHVTATLSYRVIIRRVIKGVPLYLYSLSKETIYTHYIP